MKKYNYAVAILKIIFCYCVVSVHFGPMLHLADFAVPAFMLLAFYFSTDVLTGSGIGDRMSRLMVPYFIWGMAGVALRCCAERSANWKYLTMQILSGMSGNSVLYFLLLCAINTIVLWFVFRVSNKWVLLVLGVLLVLSFALQYSGLNQRAWNWLPLHMKMAYGKMIELLPYAIAGCVISRIDFASRSSRTRLVVIVTSMLIVLHEFCSGVRYFQIGGFGCQGVDSFVVTIAICLIAIVGGSFWKCNGECTLARPLVMVASLTPGIFYAHKLVGQTMEVFITLGHGYARTAVIFLVTMCFVYLIKRSRFNLLVK